MTVTEIVPDDAALRHARRTRVLAAMEADDIDLLVVGREGNARYVSGTPRLWTAGSRAFGPGCVLVRQTGAVHLLSTWEEGVPEEIPHEHLYGISFNSSTILAALQRIEGAATARRVATDSLTGSAAGLLRKAFPAGQLVDGEPMLRRVRRIKTPEEVAAIRASVQVAGQALDAARAALVPGVTERQLTGAFMGAMAAAGVTTPATQDVAWITSGEDPWRRLAGHREVDAGDLVAFDGAVILGGYSGELGVTAVAGEAQIDSELARGWSELRERLLQACRPGAPLSDLLDAYDAVGVPPPPTPVARGLGLGFDLPLVTHALPKSAAEQTAEEGMVFALTAFVWKEGVGALYGVDPILLTADGPELLTSEKSDARSR